ncbi:MAG: universal stress protein [Aureliella sp.]
MKVLFATDGSAYAAEAARVLGEMEVLHPIDLTVLTVSYDPEDLESDVYRPWYKEFREKEDERIRNHYDQIHELLPHTRSVHMMHLHGNPTHRILEVAREQEIDLIVLGAKGHTMLERILVGSVSEAVAFHAPCSVLVIRPEETTEANETETSGNKITLAYDGSSRAGAAAEELLSLRWNEDTQVEIVGVAPVYDTVGFEYAGPVTIPEFSDQIRGQAEKLREELVETLPRTAIHLSSERHIGDAIVRRAEETGSNMIVMGDSGHSPLGKLILGSTTKYVLRHAPCSVWISRFPCAERAQEAVKAKAESTESTVDSSQASQLGVSAASS